MNNILTYLAGILGFNAYHFDMLTKHKNLIFSSFDFDFPNIKDFAKQSQKNTYTLINSSDFFVISILTQRDELIFLVPNFTLLNYVDKDLNFLFVLSRLKLLCQLIYETYTGKAAPNDDIFVVGAQPESIYLNDNSMQQDMISLNESNIYLLRTILSHNKKEFLNEKSKILKNKFLIHELNSEYSQNTLIEYTVLLTNILINNGYPRKDIYSIKTQIYRIISHNHSQTLNTTLLDQIFCLFFNILLDETYTSELNLSQKIKNHIDRNISQSLTLPDIANNLNIPLKELNPQFKSKYKVAINQYIRKQKVSLSKSLLYATNLSLQDIATFVGFNSLSYFISTFKSIVGKTPAEYRKFCKENNTKKML